MQMHTEIGEQLKLRHPAVLTAAIKHAVLPIKQTLWTLWVRDLGIIFPRHCTLVPCLGQYPKCVGRKKTQGNIFHTF